jgi:hypothetical protein
LKKLRSLFFRNKKIVSSKKELEVLNQKQKDNIVKIEEITKLYNAKSSSVNSFEEYVESLSIQSLKDLSDVSNNKKNDYNLSTLALRAKLKNEHELTLNEMAKTAMDIYFGSIDLLLAKIECVQEKIIKND